jgi:predicted methyltransferase
MKTADMLLQTEHVSRWFDQKRIIFMGDGDAIGLSLVHLHEKKLIESGPKSVHILDFDERVVLSVRAFAKRFGIAENVTSELYNVADALPQKHWEQFDGFYTNPPYGASNNGKSIEVFLRRGIEAVGEEAIGCLVIADYDELSWTKEVLLNSEEIILNEGFIIREMLPKFHTYHLDDTPDLTSCSIIMKRVKWCEQQYDSKAIDKSMLDYFYGEQAPLRVKYVRDLTDGGKRASSDHKLVPWEGEKRNND